MIAYEWTSPFGIHLDEQRDEEYARHSETCNRLANLAANLRVAGALCASFELAWWGRMRYSHDGKPVWRPNVSRLEAPGWEQT